MPGGCAFVFDAACCAAQLVVGVSVFKAARRGLVYEFAKGVVGGLHQPVIGIAKRAALAAAVVAECDQGVGLSANHGLMKFSVAKVTIIYFGAQGIGAFCDLSGYQFKILSNSSVSLLIICVLYQAWNQRHPGHFSIIKSYQWELLQQLNEKDKQTAMKIINTMLTKAKLKNFLNKNIAAL